MDLVPITDVYSETTAQLHPHLFPLARSTDNPDYFICALRRPNADGSLDLPSETPWPIVESKLNGPGYKLLSLNSEHLMRRIAAQSDFHTEQNRPVSRDYILDLYNQGLGQGLLRDRALDTPYERGSVDKLGYGLDKYVLLRVGPFPDLYVNMSQQHLQRGDESSSLIAAEAANSKFTGFASTFLSYSKLLASMAKRDEEAKDAARVCLRLPLSSVGMEEEDLMQMAELADLIHMHHKESQVSEETRKKHTFEKLLSAVDKIRNSEQEDERTRASMTPIQLAIEEGNQLLDRTVLSADLRDWSAIRHDLASVYLKAGMNDMATFVNPTFQ
jgi:hypothetical protein